MIKKFKMKLKELAKMVIPQPYQYLSQAGQDLWVFGEVFNGMKGGYFLDIGAHDGVSISNTYLLERHFGWKGICIEANPDSFAKLTKCRSARCVNACLYFEEGVKISFARRSVFGGIVADSFDNRVALAEEKIDLITTTLEKVLDSEGAPKTIDYLSIDVEGAEESILSNFNFDKYRFKCITIERPSIALRERLNKFGYVLVKNIPDLDAFYIHESFLEEYHKNLIVHHRQRGRSTRWHLLFGGSKTWVMY